MTYISFWWLIPITKKEADYAEKHGVEALEKIFEKKRVDVLDVKRKSVVPSFW
jgi:Suppressor of fused protein (SUFU)